MVPYIYGYKKGIKLHIFHTNLCLSLKKIETIKYKAHLMFFFLHYCFPISFYNSESIYFPSNQKKSFVQVLKKTSVIIKFQSLIKYASNAETRMAER